MKLLHESLKNNTTALKMFIQYEVLQKKPVFESYKTFCKAMGPEIMDYQEFEFWYMRFYNDELDLDYDRSQDPKLTTLCELPEEIMGKIVKELDPIDRIMTRHTSKSLQACVDRHKTSIEIDLLLNENLWTLVDGIQSLIYKKTGNGFQIFSKNRSLDVSFEIKGGDFMRTVLSDLKCFHIEHLKLDVERGNMEVGLLNDFKSSLHVKKLTIGFFSYPHLELMKPGILETIVLTDFTYLNVVKTEQWKQAKAIECNEETYSIPASSEEDFYHLQKFKVKFRNMTRIRLARLRDNIFKMETFEKCEITTKTNLADVREVFGDHINNDRVEIVPIPDSTDYLEVVFHKTDFTIERKKA